MNSSNTSAFIAPGKRQLPATDDFTRPETRSTSIKPPDAAGEASASNINANHGIRDAQRQQREQREQEALKEDYKSRLKQLKALKAARDGKCSCAWHTPYDQPSTNTSFAQCLYVEEPKGLKLRSSAVHPWQGNWAVEGFCGPKAKLPLQMTNWNRWEWKNDWYLGDLKLYEQRMMRVKVKAQPTEQPKEQPTEKSMNRINVKPQLAEQKLTWADEMEDDTPTDRETRKEAFATIASRCVTVERQTDNDGWRKASVPRPEPSAANRVEPKRVDDEGFTRVMAKKNWRTR